MSNSLSLKKNLLLLSSSEDLLKIISKSVLGVEIFNNEVTIHIKRKDLLKVCRLLRDHSLLQFKSVVDITCVDYPTKAERFEIIYNFLSYKNNSRLLLKVTSNEITPIPSIVSLFKGAGWLEREVWDLFGVLFIGNPDLRRILTDYGFEGFPLRKDFPLTGFIEVRYDDEKKTVVYESLEVSQEFRLFNFGSPWEQIDNLSSYEKLK